MDEEKYLPSQCLTNYKSIQNELRGFAAFIPESHKRKYLMLLHDLDSNNNFLNSFYNIDKKGVFIRPYQVHDLKDASITVRRMFRKHKSKSNDEQFEYFSEVMYLKELSNYLEKQLKEKSDGN